MKFSIPKLMRSALLLSVALLLAACGGGATGGSSPAGAAFDNTPPTITATSPANNAPDVAIHAAITATFSEAMSVSTINAVNFTLFNGAKNVAGTVTYSGTVATFTPTIPLAYATSYAATITTGVKDAAGNALVNNYTWTFTSTATPDQTPPTITATSPANGATGFAVSSVITVTFSEAMMGSTINATNFTLVNGANSVAGTVTYSGTTATFTPDSPLAYSTQYTAIINTGVKDASGNALASNQLWAFTTSAAPDITPPTVTATSPANGTTGFAVNSAITATFSEAMTTSTVNATNFTLINGANSVAGIVTYNGTTATFTPNSPLAYSTTYTAIINTGVKDASGNALASNYIWTFTTGIAPDVTPPTVAVTSPANNATGVAVNSVITATFSETMTTSTVNATNFTLNNGVTGTVTFSGTAATFTPSGNLAYSTTYTATITTGVKDAANNAMVNNYIWTFITDVPSINDTGITNMQCYQAAANIVLGDCSTAGATTLNPAQDGMVGRDVTTNLTNDGKLGFSFTAMPGGCVLDNVTSLIWEVKTTDGGLRDWTKTYTNYDSTLVPQKLSGAIYVNPTQTEIDAATNSVGFVTAVNSTNLCGFNDWRLPNADELQSIVDYGVIPGVTASIDANWFSSTSGGAFWSASPYVSSYNFAWFVHFGAGVVDRTPREGSYSVRLVRGGQIQALPRYAVSVDGQEVADKQTNLTWRRCAEGMFWDGTTCTGTALQLTYDAALQRAKDVTSLTATAWRLPNIKELASIADKSLLHYPMDATAFPASPSGLFFSASPYVGNSAYAWYVRFYDGAVGSGGDRTLSLYVRLVRAGQ